MTPEQLGIFVDTKTGRPLQLLGARVVDGQVRAGTLRSDRDGRQYQIEGFIPRFVGEDNYAQNFGIQWQIHQHTQLDSHTGATYSHDRLRASTGWSADMRGQRVLEAGCGAGRFTEVVASTGAEIVSFDYSEAVVANYQNNGQRRNVSIFQGDIYDIPLPKGSFDKVLCLGVLQHTPNVALSFRCLAEMVRPGGQLVVDVYPRRLRAMLHWKYVFRPLSTRIPPHLLYRFASWYAPKLMPLARVARRLGGRAGHRLVPILDQSDKAVPPHVQRDWTILDTFDALSARFDAPQTASTLVDWFNDSGFEAIEVLRDVPQACGLVVRGKRPA